jgi:hypothetical protein
MKIQLASIPTGLRDLSLTEVLLCIGSLYCSDNISASCCWEELGRSDSSFEIFGAGNIYPIAPLSNDDHKAALSSPRVRLMVHTMITVNNAAI